MRPGGAGPDPYALSANYDRPDCQQGGISGRTFGG